MQIGSLQFTLEEATTPGQQAMGLAHRNSIPSDRGMIFVYPQDNFQTRGNTDVRIPLDFLFLDAGGQVVSIQHLDAYSDQSTQPVEYRYVIELNAGSQSQLGIHIGDRLALSRDLTPPQALAIAAPPVATTQSTTQTADTSQPPVRGGQPLLPTTTMQIGSRRFIVEEATTPKEQEDGLMRRDYLPSDHGMIFIFDKTGEQTFWNHDVPFPLDNLFVDDSGTIVSIQHMDAYSNASTEPVLCRYVIELNAGEPAFLGIHVGDHLTIPADARAH